MWLGYTHVTLHEQLFHALESDPLKMHRETLGSQGDGVPVRRLFAAGRVVMADSYSGLAHTPDSPGTPTRSNRTWIGMQRAPSANTS